jgi:hypothetical protein
MTLWKGAHYPPPWNDGWEAPTYTEDEQRILYDQCRNVPKSAVEDLRRKVFERFIARVWPTKGRFTIPASRGSVRDGARSVHAPIVPHPERRDRAGYEEGMKEVWATLMIGGLKDHTARSWAQASVSGLAQIDAYVRRLEARLQEEPAHRPRGRLVRTP